MRSSLAILATIGVSLTGCAAPDEARPPDPRWEARAALPDPLQESPVVVLDGEVVLVGGIEDGSVTTDRVEAWDPLEDQWRSLPALPVRMHHANAAVVDGRIVVAGHLDPGFGEEGGVYVYDPATGWETRDPMPAHLTRGSAAVGVLDGRMHLVGGLQGGRAVATHSVYDPATDTWTELPDAPLARDHAAAAVIDGVLYVVGGRDGTIAGHTAYLEAFDGVGWTRLAPMPTSRGGLAAAALAGRLHVVGGEGADNSSGVFDDHEVYDPLTDTWDVLGAMRTPRHGMGAAGVEGMLVVPGGADVAGLAAVDTHEVWLP